MSKVKPKCHFRDEWLEHEKFKRWVKKIPSDHQKAYCTYCMTEISVCKRSKTFLKMPCSWPIQNYVHTIRE